MKNIVLIGGSKLLAELTLELKNNKIKFFAFTSKRQLIDPIDVGELTLESFFKQNKIELNVSDNINTDLKFIEVTNNDSVVIGLGQSWILTKHTLDRLKNKLFDFMGIDLPRFRGGAHYSWQILMGDKRGACHIETIDENTVQGVKDTGIVLKSKEYLFPKYSKIPIDYFNHAVKEEISFLKEFIQEINTGVKFKEIKLEEEQSTYYPRLNTIKNGLIDWSNDINYIFRFICAFDTPYPGSSTFLKNIKYNIKSVSISKEKFDFHPFQAGLVFRKSNDSIFVCCKGGALIIKEVLKDKVNIINEIRLGERFYTPFIELEKSSILENEL